MIQHSPSQTTETGETQTCPQCETCEGCQETENTSSGNLETPTGECLADLSASNSSLLEFYNEVMTFNDSVVELVCCKLDGSNVSVSCGKGLSCAAACYSEDAVLCPSHNCEDCDNVDAVGEASEQRQERGEEQRNKGMEERKGGWSWSTLFSGKMSHCTRRGCPVRKSFKYCCFHPVCRGRKRRQCSWLQYFVGR